MPEDKEPLKIKLGIGEIPIPRWTLGWFGTIAVLFAVAAAALHLWPEVNAVVSQKQVSEQLASDNQEYALHAFDKPEATYTVFDDALRGKLSVLAFGDGCLTILRQAVHGKPVVKLVRDLSRMGQAMAELAVPHLFPVSLAGARQMRCLDPHPGRPVSSQYGAHEGCVAQMWWTFADGCQGYQFQNTCSGAYETYPNGVPLIHWTRCVH